MEKYQNYENMCFVFDQDSVLIYYGQKDRMPEYNNSYLIIYPNSVEMYDALLEKHCCGNTLSSLECLKFTFSHE